MMAVDAQTLRKPQLIQCRRRKTMRAVLPALKSSQMGRHKAQRTMISVLKSASDDNEATGECPETVAWLLAKGPRSMVHYNSPTNVPTKAACGRNFKGPEMGLVSAKLTAC